MKEMVAPLAGAWIEIDAVEKVNALNDVAPLAGAWIEMSWMPILLYMMRSLPLRERGLKLELFYSSVKINAVAPLAGAWIEISYTLFL